DTIVGGRGADTMTGGAGDDTFVYASVEDSTELDQDAIVGFELGDLIDLSAIDAHASTAENEAFAFIGASAFSSTAGELRATQTGADWLIEGDVDGDGIAELVIGLSTNNAHILGASDFVL